MLVSPTSKNGQESTTQGIAQKGTKLTRNTFYRTKIWRSSDCRSSQNLFYLKQITNSMNVLSSMSLQIVTCYRRRN